MNIKLKACPFCGGAAKESCFPTDYPTEHVRAYVQCKECGAEIYRDGRKENASELVAKAAEAWNARKHDKKLAEYREAEEQGLLSRLPCKVGDTVYFLWRCSDETLIIHQATVKEMCIGTYMLKKTIKYKIEPKGNCGMVKIFYSEDWGYNIFTTKAEAEAALAKKKEE